MTIDTMIGTKSRAIAEIIKANSQKLYNYIVCLITESIRHGVFTNFVRMYFEI